jgi:hypothetical protein
MYSYFNECDNKPVSFYALLTVLTITLPTKCHNPTLNGGSAVPLSEVCMVNIRIVDCKQFLITKAECPYRVS